MLKRLQMQLADVVEVQQADVWAKHGQDLKRVGGSESVVIIGSSFEVPLRDGEPRAWMVLPKPPLAGDERAVLAGMSSSLMVPLMAHGEARGVLVIYAKPAYAFEHGDGVRVQGLTNELAEDLLKRQLKRVAKRTTEAMRAANDNLAALGRLSAGLAHEINNPSAYVLNNLEFLRQRLDAIVMGEEPRNESLTAMVAAVEESLDGIKRIRGIVADLSVFAIQPGDGPEAVDVNRLVRGVAKLAAGDIRARAQLVFDLGNVPAIVTDKQQLTQVLLNLTVNAAAAIRDTSSSPQQIRFRTSATGGLVTIEVEDVGGVVPLESRAHLFEPFSISKLVGGELDIGVSSTRELVKKLGGTLSFESRDGGGTVFKVKLPCDASREDLADPTVARSAFIPRRCCRVLIVDDEVAILRALKRSLGIDHDVTTVETGEHALELLTKERFDIIICDLLLPGLTGMEIYDRVCAEHPAMAARMVFMTGGAVTPQAALFIKNQRARTLSKPLEADDLARVIIEVSEEARIRDNHMTAWSSVDPR